MEENVIPDPITTALAHAEAIESTRAQQQSFLTDIINSKFTEILVNITVLQKTQEGTNEHLRILNGKVAAHEASLTTLMLWKAEAKGFGGAVSIGWSTVISLISGGAVALFYWTTHR